MSLAIAMIAALVWGGWEGYRHLPFFVTVYVSAGIAAIALCQNRDLVVKTIREDGNDQRSPASLALWCLVYIAMAVITVVIAGIGYAAAFWLHPISN